MEVEDYYYTAIYDVLQNRDLHAAKATILNKLRAKIVILNSAQRMGALTLWHLIFFSNVSTLCKQNVNNTGTKNDSPMK